MATCKSVLITCAGTIIVAAALHGQSTVDPQLKSNASHGDLTAIEQIGISGDLASLLFLKNLAQDGTEPAARRYANMVLAKQADQDAFLAIANRAFFGAPYDQDDAVKELIYLRNPAAFVVLREMLYDETGPEHDRDVVFLSPSETAMRVALPEMIPDPPAGPLNPLATAVRRKLWLDYFRAHPDLTAVTFDWSVQLVRAARTGDSVSIRTIGRLSSASALPTISAARKQSSGASIDLTFRAVLAKLGSDEDFAAIRRDLESNNTAVRRRAVEDLYYVKNEPSLGLLCGVVVRANQDRSQTDFLTFAIKRLEDWASDAAMDPGTPLSESLAHWREWCQKR